MKEYKLVSGTANPDFAKKIAKHLGTQLVDVQINKFSDGEIDIKITESVRGADVFIIQPTCNPANDNLIS